MCNSLELKKGRIFVCAFDLQISVEILDPIWSCHSQEQTLLSKLPITEKETSAYSPDGSQGEVLPLPLMGPWTTGDVIPNLWARSPPRSFAVLLGPIP